MQLLTWLQPRDVHAGTRVVSALSGVALVVTLLFLPLSPHTEHTNLPLAVSGILAFLVVVALTVVAWYFDEGTRLAWGLSPVLTIAAIVVVDLATHDATISAQVFFLFPTLYAAALLPRPGAVLVTAAAICGEAVVVAGQLPVRVALVDIGYVGAALTATAAMLIRGSERQSTLMAALERRAETDPLTGLVTRWVFDRATEAALLGHVDDAGTSLILLDVDRFKLINDEHGHPGGDMVLVQLANLLVRKSRRGDVVCRLGGDEVALLLPGCTTDIARRRAEQLVEEVRWHPFAVGDGSIIHVSVSAGLAHAPTHATTAGALYQQADTALYEAKRSGRDRLVEVVRSA